MTVDALSVKTDKRVSHENSITVTANFDIILEKQND